MNRYKNKFNNRNRSLLVNSFEPKSEKERKILEIAKAVNEDEVRYLKYVLEQHGYPIISAAWEDLQNILNSGQEIHSPKKFLTYLIERKLYNK